MLRDYDLFHSVVKLNYNQKSKFTTNAGCFFTTCVILITLSQVFTTFIPILTYRSPQVTIDREVLENPGSLSLKPDEFVFAVRILDMELNSSYYSLNMSYYKYIMHEGGDYEEIYTKFPFKRCTAEYLKNYTETFEAQGLSEGLCPDSDDFQISGSYRGDYAEQIVISVSACTNDTRNPEIICKPKEEIDAYFEEADYLEVEFWYSNTIISPTNHSAPVRYYLDLMTWPMLPGIQATDALLFVNEQEILTDDNLLIPNWYTKNQTTYQVDAAEMRAQPWKPRVNDDGGELIIQISLLKSSYKYTTQRKYPKIQEGLADVGSVFSICVVVFGVFARMYMSRVYPLRIANQIYEYDFPEETPKEPRKSETPDKNKRRKSTKNNRRGSGKGIELPEVPKKKTIRYNFGDFILSFLPCIKRRKDVFVQKVVDTARKDIDLLEIVKKLHEYERLKRILLDEDELKLLAYQKLPVIREKDPEQIKSELIEAEKRKSMELEGKSQPVKPGIIEKYCPSLKSKEPPPKSKQNRIIEAVDICSSYNRLMKKMKFSPISRKILQFMDPKTSDAYFEFGMKSATLLTKAGKEVKFDKASQMKPLEDQKMSKFDAGLIISRNLESYYLKRKRKKSKGQMTGVWKENNPNNSEILEEFSVMSEKQLLQHEAQQLDSLNRSEQYLLSPTLKLQRNNQIETQISYRSPEQQNNNGHLPPVTSFPISSVTHRTYRRNRTKHSSINFLEAQ